MSTADDLHKLPGMKERELRERATCLLCRNKVGASAGGLGLFYKVTVERYMIDSAALRRQGGLEMMLGHSGIAQAMGPDEDLAKAVMTPVVVTVCENCAYGDRMGMLIALALEKSAEI